MAETTNRAIVLIIMFTPRDFSTDFAEKQLLII